MFLLPRQDKLEDLADEAILPLFDALSDLFAECVKIVESDFCNDEFGLLEVKIENQIELAFDGETRANSSGGLTAVIDFSIPKRASFVFAIKSNSLFVHDGIE